MGNKCEYACAKGYTVQNGQCIQQQQQVFQCTGTTPANSQLCTGSDAGLSKDTAKALVTQCTMGNKCEYTCTNGYTLQNGQCVQQQQIQPVSVIGKKIMLTDVTTANNVFSTTIKATETFANEVTRSEEHTS